MGHTIIIVNISEGDQEKNLSFCSVLKTLSSLCKKKVLNSVSAKVQTSLKNGVTNSGVTSSDVTMFCFFGFFFNTSPF